MKNWLLWANYRIGVMKALRKYYKFSLRECWSISETFKENFDPTWKQDPIEDVSQEMQYWTE